MTTSDQHHDDQAWIAEADAALASTCPGWRRNRRCTDETGRQLPDPHRQCLEALEHYRVILLEQGELSVPPRPWA